MFQTLGYPPSLAVVTKNSGLCWKHCEQSIDSRGNGTRWQEIRLRMLWSRQGFPCPWLQLHSKSLWQNTCSLRSTDVFLRLRKDFWISSLHLRAFDAGKVLPKSSWGKFGSDSHCKLLSNENGGWWSLILSQFKGYVCCYPHHRHPLRPSYPRHPPPHHHHQIQILHATCLEPQSLATLIVMTTTFQILSNSTQPAPDVHLVTGDAAWNERQNA